MTAEKLYERDVEDIRALLSTREGVRFFSRLMTVCGIFRLSHTPGDTHATAFSEGQRNIGLMFYGDLLEAEPEAGALLRRGVKEREVFVNDGDE